MSKSDPASQSARFTAFIDDAVTDQETEADSASNAAATGTTPQRPPTASGMTSESSADIQLRSLLRDEFIIRQVDEFAEFSYSINVNCGLIFFG